jgi:hypothetical protein
MAPPLLTTRKPNTGKTSDKVIIMIRKRKTYVGMLISLLWVTVVVSSAHADAGFLLSRMKPERVFEMTLLWDAANQHASQWKLACSIMPDNEALAVCLP